MAQQISDKEFTDIVHITKKIVLSAIRKNLAERFYHSIDDVVQETYVRAYKSLIKNKFRGDSSLNSWLYTIARNESLRMNKKLGREEVKAQRSIDNFEVESIEHKNEDPDLDIQKIENMIKELPNKYRTVMELVSQGLQEREISQRLNIKLGTVKSRKSRGRKILNKLLQEVRYEI